jgi:hypothetical protein
MCIHETAFRQYIGFLEAHSILKNEKMLGIPNFKLEPSDPNEVKAYIPDEKFQIPKKMLLGKGAEYLFELSLSFQDKYSILAKNIQIIDKGITLGELDFILEDEKDKVYIHLELTFKFYLFNPDQGGNECSHWIGPNKRDSLSDKLAKLSKKQFPLLTKPVTQKELSSLGIDLTAIKQEICFKGYLFVPKVNGDIAFKNVNELSVIGYWIKDLAFSVEEYGEYQYYIPTKQLWMCDPKYNNEWSSFNEVRRQVDHSLKSNLSPLIWRKDEHGNCERFFVVWW